MGRLSPATASYWFITVTVAVAGHPPLSLSVSVTVVSAAMELSIASTVKVSPAKAPGLVITAGVPEVTVYGAVPPVIVNSCVVVPAEHVLSISQIEAEVGEILGEFVHVIVILAETVAPTASNTVRVTISGVAVAGTVTVIGEPVQTPVSVASIQSESVELQDFEGLLEVVV